MFPFCILLLTLNYNIIRMGITLAKLRYFLFLIDCQHASQYLTYLSFCYLNAYFEIKSLIPVSSLFKSAQRKSSPWTILGKC